MSGRNYQPDYSSWNMRKSSKKELNDMKGEIETILSLKRNLRQDELMLLILNHKRKLVDMIIYSRIVKNPTVPFSSWAYGIAYKCPKCSKPSFIRQFKSFQFKCYSCEYETQSDDIDELTRDVEQLTTPKDRMELLEDIGKGLVKKWKNTTQIR
jgi:hypothetical protein